jgi:Lrp/AsnC family transcriptional regulator for asnA, asnC and gidA
MTESVALGGVWTGDAVGAATNVREKDQVSIGGAAADRADGATDGLWAIPGENSLLDDANRAIIESLQRDGRRAYAQIAREVGLSEAAVRRRVQQLRASGVIQIVAVTDPLQLGFRRQALIGISVEGDVRDVAAKVVPLPEVDYVVMCAGSFDLLVEVVCEGDERLLHILNDSIRSIPGVRSTETFMYLKLAKQTYTWGTR